jgi:hypothetical protein
MPTTICPSGQTPNCACLFVFTGDRVFVLYPPRQQEPQKTDPQRREDISHIFYSILTQNGLVFR